MKFVYCSGPLFCPEEIAGMSAIERVLQQAGFGTFLPHRDGLERHVLGLVNTPLNTNLLWARDMIDSAIFALDVFQIVRRCEYFVLNMNGRVPDEGAVAEAGMAFAAGRPLVLFKNDRRSVFKGSDNSMLTGLSVLKPVSDLTKLPSALLQAENALKKSLTAGCPALPLNVKRVVRKGERIWRVLSCLPIKDAPSAQTGALLQQILDLDTGDCD